MRIAVIGGVTSTRVLVEKLHQHGFSDVHVFGYSPEKTDNVSGWSDLSGLANHNNYSFTPFVRISDFTAEILQLAPDIIFAVGLSQLIPEAILSVPRLGSVGFHPTALPKGRGRAPIAWLVLEKMDGAATFFILQQGIDDGPILVQEPFHVDANDTAGTVEAKVLLAEANALDRWLPHLASGSMAGIEQNHNEATWYGRRTPEDGWIDWHKSGEKLLRLIRASTRPHPGAYTFRLDIEIRIWAADMDTNYSEHGVVGRILRTDPAGSFTVQCGKSQTLTVTEWESTGDWKPKVGELLGYYSEVEIHSLRQRQNQLEESLRKLERLIINNKDYNPHIHEHKS